MYGTIWKDISFLVCCKTIVLSDVPYLFSGGGTKCENAVRVLEQASCWRAHIRYCKAYCINLSIILIGDILLLLPMCVLGWLLSGRATAAERIWGTVMGGWEANIVAYIAIVCTSKWLLQALSRGRCGSLPPLLFKLHMRSKGNAVIFSRTIWSLLLV